ncbi:MAG: OmpA family protein [Chitinophagales bacterium]|nr:OmpA family protein [Chitinophagales bacterium]
MMNTFSKFALLLLLLASLSSCVAKKKFTALQQELALSKTELAAANKDLGKCGVSLNEYMNRLSICEQERANALKGQQLYEDQILFLKSQLADCQNLRDKQLSQVGDLTKINKSANDNIRETLSQLERKDKYLNLLQAAKTRADSINLALAVNLTQMLRDGIEDRDIEIKVDKTVVFVNLSDKMLYQSGNATLTPRAQEVLDKIAQIVSARPELEVMVEGYTDNVPIKNSCMEDNWDLSVKRATAVVRALQKQYKVNPNRLIAAGRGEYNALASNDTEAGRATNRRTRIIILPKLDQFYDLLDPSKAAGK